MLNLNGARVNGNPKWSKGCSKRLASRTRFERNSWLVAQGLMGNLNGARVDGNPKWSKSKSRCDYDEIFKMSVPNFAKLLEN